MKKLLLFYFLLTGFVLPAQAQSTYFTLDSIWSPPYICQATAFHVEVFGTRSSMAVQDSTQNYFFSHDTVFVRFHFNGMGGLMPTPPPLYRQILVPAPPIGQYKVVVQGFYNGHLHQTITSTLSVCSTIAGTKEQIPEDFQVMIYPNPASNFLTINLPGNSKVVALTLTDANGKICLRRKETALQNLKLDLKDFPDGIYFLKLETERGSVIKKVVKQ